MAHAYKKTLLAQLGFADADKQNPKHDLAVEYLALEHNAKRLIQQFHSGMTWEKQTTERVPYGFPGEEPRGWRWQTLQLHELGTPERERPLTKGEDRYKTTIGFLDLTLRYTASTIKWIQRADEQQPRNDYDEFGEEQSVRSALVVEVKAQPLATGDLLRQMKLYQEYAECLHVRPHGIRWVVAGCFKFTETQARALRQERITPVSLGALFDEWAERQRTDRTLATGIEEF